MSSNHPLEAVQRKRRVEIGRDRYDEPIYDAITSDLPPALYAPGGRQETPEPGRDPVILEPALYWRGQWPDIQASDQLIVRGETFDVIGDPGDWRGSRTGGLHVTVRTAKEGAA